MITAFPLDAHNLKEIQSLYKEFMGCAKDKYRWDIDPIEFSVLQSAIEHKLMYAIMVQDVGAQKPLGFMLYRLEDHQAIEINLIYFIEPSGHVPPEKNLAHRLSHLKTWMDSLMRCFLSEIKALPDWTVVSYAMLGVQSEYIRTITWYGFKPMGQAILTIDLMDEITLQILMQQKLKPLEAHYQIVPWSETHQEGVAQVLYEAFSNAADALWDPRFRTFEGALSVVELVVSGAMGPHIPKATQIMLNQGKPVAVCFFLEAKLGVGNIPLVGVLPSEKGKGLGGHLLKATLDSALKLILANELGLYLINATMETDNLPAIRMYRRMGFREDYNYPHVYLPYEDAMKVTPGQWCVDNSKGPQDNALKKIQPSHQGGEP
ncbi:MAG: GNAT family N-acetyltransferase [Cyanobacteria bacterium]|nr:GNAT family N-acetyltransferase [Cyanobacteriota bacterium]